MNSSLSKKLIQTSEAAIFIRLSKLKKYNITIGNKKTSVTLEPLVWELLHDIANEQGCHINDLCEFINERKNLDASLASAIRIFILAYTKIQQKEQK